MKIPSFIAPLLFGLCGLVVIFFFYHDTRFAVQEWTFQREKKIAPVEDGNVSILFVGDMLFDRYIRQVAIAEGEDFIFSCIDPLLQKPDFVVGNLEGPITSEPSVSIGSKVGSPENYRFTFPTSTAALLSRHNVRVVNLGNNHISNFDLDGVRSTRQFLTDVGVNYFGGLWGDEPIFRFDKGTTHISFIGYNEFGGNEPEHVAQKIKNEKESGRIVIVYTHWGEEYSEDIASLRDIAKSFAEAGADAIFGSHPHIVLPHERIGKTDVYYSLGNFIFDQYFNEAVSTGLAVELSFSKEGMVFKEYKTYTQKDGKTCSVD